MKPLFFLLVFLPFSFPIFSNTQEITEVIMLEIQVNHHFNWIKVSSTSKWWNRKDYTWNQSFGPNSCTFYEFVVTVPSREKAMILFATRTFEMNYKVFPIFLNTNRFFVVFYWIIMHASNKWWITFWISGIVLKRKAVEKYKKHITRLYHLVTQIKLTFVNRKKKLKAK